jgi:hypothetical protein
MGARHAREKQVPRCARNDRQSERQEEEQRPRAKALSFLVVVTAG